MDEVIIYILPTGQRVAQDPNRVSLMPSDGGEISFKSPDGARRIGPYRVGVTHIEYTLKDNEVTGAIAEIELEAVDGTHKGNE